MKPDLLDNVPVTVTVELGSAKMTVKELEALSQGSVIELNLLAGEPLTFLVNGKKIAYGEVVVVNEKFGIRLTDIIGEQEPE